MAGSFTWSVLPDDEALATQLERARATYEPGVDLALDGLTGDMEIPPRFTTGPEAVVQGIRIRCQTFLGEVFSDLDEGVDYFGVILGQKYVENDVKGEFRDAIVASPGVDDLLLLTSQLDSATRICTIRFKVRTSFGVVQGEITGGA